MPRPRILGGCLAVDSRPKVISHAKSMSHRCAADAGRQVMHLALALSPQVLMIRRHPPLRVLASE
jgi:hypothetical protein